LSKSLNTSALTRTFQALADPTRREILRLLADGDLNAGQIASNFHIALPSVSHHLSVLKNANLVSAERDGQSIVYSLNSSVAQEALQLLLTLTGAGAEKRGARPRTMRGTK
jgi:DNA-binding transcriptional ArsR family regulator